MHNAGDSPTGLMPIPPATGGAMNDAQMHRIAAMSEIYQTLVEGITDYAIYMLDPNGFVATWNKGAERSKGYSAAEIIGKHFSTFYTIGDRDIGLPARALAIATDQGRFEAEGWRVRKDGSRYWAHVIIDVIRDEQMTLVGFAKITRDLTERRKAQADLQRSESQFRLLVEGVKDHAIYMLDAEGVVSGWNSGAELIKGYDRNEIIGQSFSRFYTAEDIAAGEPARALEVASRLGKFESEGWRLRKDGTRFWASTVISAVRDDAGQLIGFAKITRDISEAQKARQALEQTRMQLFHAQKMEAIGQLTGGIAHDFNNLLAAVLGSLDILRSRIPDSPQTRPLINNAMTGAERGAALTRQLLAFSRREELDFEAVDLEATLNGALELLRLCVGPDITIVTHIHPDLPKIHSDSNQLTNAMLNLALNARDAMPAGGRLTISAELRSDPAIHVRLTFSDEGQGMDEATLAAAATPFFTTKGVGKGTGLGLSMVRGLMEQSGGRLVLTSTIGQGTSAQMWLPLAAAQEAAVEERKAEEAGATAAPKALKVLAVDDDALVLMSTAMMLEELGHTVVEAHSGEAALRILSDDRSIELVVTDFSMPRMTGAELADAANVERPDVRFVLATGFTELPKEANPDMLRLSKPFTQKQLAEILERAMNLDPAAGAATGELSNHTRH
jgi:PAS domain S-box-containing protein